MLFSAPSSGSPTSSFGDATFEGELSPEDLFNMFFGAGPVSADGSGDLSCRAHGTNVWSDAIRSVCLWTWGFFLDPWLYAMRTATRTATDSEISRLVAHFSLFSDTYSHLALYSIWVLPEGPHLSFEASEQFNLKRRPRDWGCSITSIRPSFFAVTKQRNCASRADRWKRHSRSAALRSEGRSEIYAGNL